MIYIVIILPIFYRVDDINDSDSKVLPASVVVSLIIFVTAVLALLPVYGWKTIPILIVLFTGFSMSLHFMPKGHLGTLVFFILLFTTSATSHLIPHNGEWDFKGEVIDIE